MNIKENPVPPESFNIYQLMEIVDTILDARDPYIMEHSLRVAENAKILSTHMNLDAKTIQKIYVSARFHDIGKIGVPDAVLNKKGKLAISDQKAIQSHSRIGYNILKRVPSLKEISEIVLFHHERHDGRGYPMGLEGEAIPIESRIIAVADAFDAITSDRPYRKGAGPREAMEEICSHSGLQFCPVVVDHFKRVLPQLNLQGERGEETGKEHFAFMGHEDLMHSRMIQLEHGKKSNRAA